MMVDLTDLYDLEEGIEEDPTPFITHIRLEEAEALSFLDQLKEIEETYEEIEEKPLIGVFEELELIGKDTKGEVHKIGAMTKGILKAEKLQKIKKNPDLIHLCNINNSKVYYNIPKDEYWIEVYRPIWINHKRTMKKVGSIKLESHDFETMLALSLCWNRGFHNPIPEKVWIRKKVRRKMENILSVC